MKDWCFSEAAPIFFHMPSTFDFCIPTRSTTVPDTPDWLHEVKYDSYRLRVEATATASG
jgi:YD repeat-containing protein